MAKADNTWDPTECLQIQDIALWETSLKRFLDYQPAQHQGRVVVLNRRGARAELLDAEDAEGQHSTVLRAIISLGMRGVVLPDDAAPDREYPDDETVVFQIEADFAVTYEVLKAPNDEQLADFVRFNCTHNVWPFWRQHVYDTLKKASLPLVAVPLFQGRASTKKARKRALTKTGESAAE
jgi:hypothetical protein